MTAITMKARLVRALYVLIVVAVLPFLIWNGFIQQVSAEWNDIIVRLRGAQATAATGAVALVAIDDQTAARYGPLPLNRARLAEGLEVLAQAHPRVVVLDLLLSEAGEPSQDARLARSLGHFPHVVLGAALEGDASENPRWILPLHCPCARGARRRWRRALRFAREGRERAAILGARFRGGTSRDRRGQAT
jgi:CHASE2 domain-containing sensor protein